MAIRHEVQNLQRRGNIFYWRARIPMRMRSSIDVQHLAFSLKQSDHHRAGYMVRKLNLLLHEISLKPESTMINKEALEKLFQSEIMRMNEHMENLQFAGQRFGSGFQNLDNMTADMEVGWAYRLLEKFGTRQALFQHPDCVGHSYLKQSAVPQELHTNIITTYHGEKHAAETPVFKAEIEALMQEHGISAGILNVEKAKAEYFRARADVLLNTEGRYVFEYPVTIQEVVTEVVAPKPIEEPIEATPPAPAENPEPVVPTIPVLAPSVTKVKAVPLKNFMKECELLIENNKSTWQADTAEDVRVIIRIFTGILAEHDVKNSSEIEQVHLAALRQHFNQILPGYGRSRRLSAMTTARLREETASVRERAIRLKQEPPKIGLAVPTIRRHLGNLKHFLGHLSASGYTMQPLNLDGLMPKKISASKARGLTQKPDPERIRPIFKIPLFTGCSGPLPKQWRVTGDQVFHSSLFYIPMFLTYLGARRAEITGLSVDDVLNIDGVWAIHIRENQFRSIKNEQSDRVLPIPIEILRLGFVDYVHRIKELGYVELFPELHVLGKLNDTGDRFYKSFMPLLDTKNGFKGELWDRTIHALRHGFTDTLKQNGVQLSTIEDITGHLGGTEGQMRYSNAANLKLMQEALAVYPVITDHLEFKKLNLLPSIEKKER